nr:3-deoxy-7-phosphoheptulonate synthase [Actinomadura rugatobispora]
MSGPREQTTGGPGLDGSEPDGAGAAPWDGLPAEQQPSWHDHPGLGPARARLAALPPLVTAAELGTLRESLARVAAGGALLLQAGDCAESLDETTRDHTLAKASVLARLADGLDGAAGLPVVRMGRMGGQFAKPRSNASERVGDRELPVFRGHMVNGPEEDAAARRHDPARMLRAYDASARVLTALAGLRGDGGAGPWTAHEALVLDYEGPLVRTEAVSGLRLLGSTHMPWIGERTRQPGGAHVRLLSAVANPVACKIGPRARPDEVLRVCAALDPDRRPGRLTLIARMGAGRIAGALPPLLDAVRRAGHPVVWLSDPMHGNTRLTASGHKTRHLEEIVEEALLFRTILERRGLHPGGLHLEVSAVPVTECVGGSVAGEKDVPERYLTFCDPRLNTEQALHLIDAWCRAPSMSGSR